MRGAPSLVGSRAHQKKFLVELVEELQPQVQLVGAQQVDDVAIGVWVQRTDPTVVPRCLSAYFRHIQVHEPIDALDVAEIVFYRHRCSEDRQEDVDNMQRLLDRICARVEHAP